MTIFIGGPGGPAFTIRPPDWDGLQTRFLAFFGLQRIGPTPTPRKRRAELPPPVLVTRKGVRPPYTKPVKQARYDAGHCVTCGNRPPQGGRQQCRPCLDRALLRQTKLNRERGKPFRPYSRGSVLIDRADGRETPPIPTPEQKRQRRLKLQRESQKARYHSRMEAGLCGRCGERAIATHSVSRCEPCLEENRESHRKRSVAQKARPKPQELALPSVGNGAVPRGNRPRKTSPTQLLRRERKARRA